MENKNIPVKPAKKTRGDILHERMVLLGEIKEEKKFDKKKFFLTSLIILCVMIAAIVVLQYRLNTIAAYEDALYAQQAAAEIVADENAATVSEATVAEAAAAVEAATETEAAAAVEAATDVEATTETEAVGEIKKPQDYTFAPFYRAGKLLLIVGACAYGFYVVIRLLAPKRRKPNRSVWGDFGIYFMLLCVAILMIFPLVFSVSASLKPLDELFRFPPTVFPRQPTMDNFSDLFVTLSQSFVPFSRYLVNTVFLTFIGTMGHVLIASMAAFVLAKYDFPGGKTFFSIVVTALMFSGYVTGIPNYVIMSKLRMIDTYWAIILPAFAAPIGLFLMKQFMEGLPTSLIEAAHLDGAGEMRIFWSIVMPNVKPAWLTIIIFSVQSLWNTNASTVIYSEAKKTLVYALQQIQAGGIARTGQAAAVTVIVMLVPITIFILSQSRILETMASSGLKD